MVDLKPEVDQILRRVYYLTNAIKKIEPLYEVTKNQRTRQVLLEVLNEYIAVSTMAKVLFPRYIEQQRSMGIIPLEHINVYRKLMKDV